MQGNLLARIVIIHFILYELFDILYFRISGLAKNISSLGRRNFYNIDISFGNIDLLTTVITSKQT